METLGKAVLELTGNLAPLTAALEEGKAESEAMAKTTATGLRGGITRAAVPAAAALAGIVIGLHKSIEAAQEDQVATARLANAFKSAGLNLNDYKDLIDQAEQSSAQLGFKSEDVKQSLGSLVVATGSAEGAVKGLSTAQDIARFKGVSLEAATKTLAMTMTGSSRAAKMLGITVIPVTTAYDSLKAKTDYASIAQYEAAKQTAYLSDKQATAAKTIDLVNQKLSGQAKAFADTAAGARDKMGAEFNLLEINIGKTLLPIVTDLTTGLAGLSEEMTKHADIVKIVIGVIGTLAAVVLAVKVATVTWNAVTAVATAAQWAWNAAMSANPIGLVVIALAALTAAIVIAWQHSQTFRDIILGVWSDVKSATTTFISFFTESVPNGFHKVLDWFGQTWNGVTSAITSPFRDAWSFIKGIPGDLVSAFGSVEHGLDRVLAGAGNVIKTLLTAPINGVIGLIDSIKIPKVHINMPWPIPDVNFGPYGPFFHIPFLAEGGMVTSPTLAMIGERGPEAVVPLSKMGDGITVNVSGVVGNEREVAVTIGRELQKLKNRGFDFALA